MKEIEYFVLRVMVDIYVPIGAVRGVLYMRTPAGDA